MHEVPRDPIPALARLLKKVFDIDAPSGLRELLRIVTSGLLPSRRIASDRDESSGVFIYDEI